MHKVARFPVSRFPEEVLSAADAPSFHHERVQLQRILDSRAFERSPRLTRLLEYLCRKYFVGGSGQLGEYTIAIELFGRPEGFEPRADASIRVDMNRLRRQLSKYYRTEGRSDPLVLSVPPGQYVPVFSPGSPAEPTSTRFSILTRQAGKLRHSGVTFWLVIFLLAAGVALGIVGSSVLGRLPAHFATLWRGATLSPEASANLARLPIPAGPELRILAGSPEERRIDHNGNVWLGDRYFTGGSRLTFTPESPSASDDHEQAMPAYAREGDFHYHVPLAPGVYELRLHFVEQADRLKSESEREKGRRFDVFINGKRLLENFDIAADAGGVGVPDVKVFTDISPVSDGLLHIKFISRMSKAMLNGIEILPGIPGKMRPVRIACRPTPYTGTDGIVWRADGDYRGGHLTRRNAAITGSQDPALFASERFGQFTYAIPVAEQGLYTVILGFAETGTDTAGASPITRGGRLFDVFCNGQTMLKNFSIVGEAGGPNRAITKVFQHIEPRPDGKILLEFVPVSNYACLSTIEVLPE